jgi:hypothetical protein
VAYKPGKKVWGKLAAHAFSPIKTNQEGNYDAEAASEPNTKGAQAKSKPLEKHRRMD